MIIKLKYFGIPTTLLNNGKEEINVPVSTNIEQLIILLSNKLGDQTGELIKSSTFLVNKSRARKDTILKDGDEVLILYALGGG